MSIDEVNKELLPKHVGLIMDGNGRWAKKKGLSRSEGHYAGVENLKEIIDYHFNVLNIPYLSVYAFSIDNFKRSEDEIAFLFSLLEDFYKNFLQKAKKDKIGFKISGVKDKLSSQMMSLIENIEKETSAFKDKVLNICFNYTGRREILESVKKIVDLVSLGFLKKEDISFDTLRGNFFVPNLPDIDLMIRTSGEQRLSDFMIWQNAYAEFFFAEDFFPDFVNQKYRNALSIYAKRMRRFGGYDE